MTFTSINFLIFFCIVFLVYYIVPKKIQWIVLLIASVYFYIFASIQYIFYVLFVSLVTYFGAIFTTNLDNNYQEKIEQYDSITRDEKKVIKKSLQRKKKLVIIITVILTLSLLIIMKYTNFIIENIAAFHSLLKLEYNKPSLNFILPIGISFYTFMSIGYVIDVYRGEYKAEKNFFKYFLFISYFPHVMQGPIDKYKDLSEEFSKPKKFNYEESVEGLSRVIVGLIKKMVVADKIAPICRMVIQYPNDYYGINILFFIVLYAIELYADFSGYMDIAIGTSKILGIKIAENFDSPYFSKSIAEYWRRWHISLGAWFRDYVYYPILRSKKADGIRKYFKEENNKYLSNTIPTVFALAILWILIGFWHGATWAFVIYGMYHGLILIISTMLSPVYNKFYKKYPKLIKSKIYGAFQVLRTFLLVLIGYFFFSAGGLKTAILLLTNMFKLNNESVSLRAVTSSDFKISVLIGIIILTILDILNLKKVNIYKALRQTPFLIRWLIYAVGIFLVTMLSSGEAQEFLYFQF